MTVQSHFYHPGCFVLSKALDLCGRRYFETPDESRIFSILQTEVDAVHDLLAGAWRRYEIVCRAMLLKNEASTHEARAAAVRRLRAETI